MPTVDDGRVAAIGDDDDGDHEVDDDDDDEDDESSVVSSAAALSAGVKRNSLSCRSAFNNVVQP